MKMIRPVGVVSALLLATGCAHQGGQAQYDESISPSVSQSSEYGNGAPMGNTSESDNRLVTEVRASLHQNPETAPVASSIHISANNGTVTFSGLVQNDEQKRQIESIARRSNWVVGVNDQLQISGETMRPTSRSNEGDSIYYDAAGRHDQSQIPASNGVNNDVNNPSAGTVQPETDNTGQSLAPTSTETNSVPRLYHDATNSLNNPTNNALSPTSRTNGDTRIYQENNQGQITNGNNKIP
jgi:hypothetical protein